MAPFYELICEEQGWTVDTDLLNKMKAENEEGLKKLDEKLKDAEENLGETEISDTLLARAEHFAKIGDKVCCPGAMASACSEKVDCFNHETADSSHESTPPLHEHLGKELDSIQSRL